jgi:hypothetical protein
MTSQNKDMLLWTAAGVGALLAAYSAFRWRQTYDLAFVGLTSEGEGHYSPLVVFLYLEL